MAAFASDGRRLTRIRVLRIITRLNVGGPALHAGLLSARLDPSRFETLLVAGREGPGEASMLDLGRLERGYRLVRVPSLVREVSPANDLRALLRLARIARGYRPHVVHTHLAKAGALGRIAALLCGASVVVHTYHGSVFRGYFAARESSLYLAIERALARVSTRLVAITPRQREGLVALGFPQGKIVMIPLGLDLSAFRSLPEREEARGRLGLLVDAPLVALVGRLVPIKDVGTFIRAVALAAREIPALRALIVGDGEERPRLEALAAELGVSERCEFLGWRADVETVYAAMDVLAVSSRNEGSPASVIEAMASGRVVVGTAVGGVPDLIRDGVDGVLVPPGDPRALAAALVRLVRDAGLRARLGAAARAAALERYHAARLVRDIERLYEELLAPHAAFTPRASSAAGREGV